MNDRDHARRTLLAAGLFILSAVFVPAAGPAPFSDLSPAQAAALIRERGADPLFVVLDVRTPGEFAENRIAGALNIDVKAPNFVERVAKLDRNAAYLVYCRGGVRSVKAMGLMKEAGFKEAFNLAGGIKAWQAENLPLDAVLLPAAAK